jgi:hypothetical protein
MNFKRAIAREWLLFLLLVLVTPVIVGLYQWARTPRVSDEIPNQFTKPRLYDLIITAPGYDAQLLIAPDLPKSKRDQEIVEFDAKHPLEKFTYTLPDTINPRTGKPYEIRSKQELRPEDLKSIKKQISDRTCDRGDVWERARCELEREKYKLRGGGVASYRDLPGGVVAYWDLPDDFVPLSPKIGLNEIGDFVDGGYLSDDHEKILGYLKSTGYLIFRKRALSAYLADTIATVNSYFYIILIYPLFLFLRSILWAIRSLRRAEA